mgnify:CR=1 FL=1
MSVGYTGDDLALAGGKSAGLRLVHYDPVARTWADLGAKVSGSTLIGSTKLTGLFALVATLPTPALTGPPDGEVTGLGPLLTWSNPNGTTQIHIQVIPINNDGPGIDLIRNAETGYQVAAPVMGVGNYVMLPGMTYSWRVRTSTAAKALGAADPGWSNWAAGAFKTQPPNNRFITPTGPPDGFVVAGLTPTVSWDNVQRDIFYYEVQLSKDQNFGPNAFLYWELRHGGLTTPVNSYRVPDNYPMEPNTTYYWRVRPRVQGDGQPVEWSTAYMFSTPAN